LTLQIKVLGPELEGIAADLRGIAWRPNYRVKLPADSSVIRFGDSRTHGAIMRAIRKAERSGVVVRRAESEDDLRLWYPLYLRAMRAGVVLPRPYRFFEQLWRTVALREMGYLLLAEIPNGGSTTLIAGSLYLQFGGTVFYAFNGRRAEYLGARPNEAIHWHAIQQACRAGLQWYDLGEADEGSSLAAFKAKWATHREMLMRYYYPAPEDEGSASGPGWARQLAKGAWRHLPLGLTAFAGTRASRFL